MIQTQRTVRICLILIQRWTRSCDHRSSCTYRLVLYWKSSSHSIWICQTFRISNSVSKPNAVAFQRSDVTQSTVLLSAVYYISPLARFPFKIHPQVDTKHTRITNILCLFLSVFSSVTLNVGTETVKLSSCVQSWSQHALTV
jgi:hypothetical protein